MGRGPIFLGRVGEVVAAGDEEAEAEASDEEEAADGLSASDEADVLCAAWLPPEDAPSAVDEDEPDEPSQPASARQSAAASATGPNANANFFMMVPFSSCASPYDLLEMPYLIFAMPLVGRLPRNGDSGTANRVAYFMPVRQGQARTLREEHVILRFARDLIGFEPTYEFVTESDTAHIGNGAGIFPSACLDERTSVMDGIHNGTQAQQDTQQQEQQATQQQTDQQETQGKYAKGAEADAGAGSGSGAEAYEKQLAERDSRIAELEAQIADAAKNAEAADGLRAEIAALREQGESDRIDFKLQLAGCRNVKAARAVLADHGGDVDALKEAEPWMFADSPQKQTGKTGLPNAGMATDEGKQMKRWEKIAGLADDE